MEAAETQCRGRWRRRSKACYTFASTSLEAGQRSLCHCTELALHSFVATKAAPAAIVNGQKRGQACTMLLSLLLPGSLLQLFVVSHHHFAERKQSGERERKTKQSQAVNPGAASAGFTLPPVGHRRPPQSHTPRSTRTQQAVARRRRPRAAASSGGKNCTTFDDIQTGEGCALFAIRELSSIGPKIDCVALFCRAGGAHSATRIILVHAIEVPPQ